MRRVMNARVLALGRNFGVELKAVMVKLPELETLDSLPAELRRVLVAVDFSDASLSAVNYASGLVARSGGSLALVHVVEPHFVALENNHTDSPPNGTEHQRLERAKQRLGSLGRG